MIEALDVLLIEDNPGDQILIKKYLSQASAPKFRLTICATLSDAKPVVKSQKFDVILLDLTLPDSDGLDSFFQIQSLVAQTPIIILTGLDANYIAGDAVRAGAQDYLIKGKHLQTLLIQSIQYAIERTNRLNQEVESAVTQATLETMTKLMQEITHDLKTPLSVIMTSSQLLGYYVDMNNPKVVKHLENIIAQSDRLRGMINSIMEMFQLNTLKEIGLQDRISVNISSVVQQASYSLEELASANNKSLECVYENQNLMVYVNVSMIIRLINNLVQNSITHTKPNTKIMIKVQQKDNHAVISVTDNGQGISGDKLPHIFDRFYRGDMARQTQTGNSGLGLAIAKQITELHGGVIDVKSKLDVGTQFTIKLPLVSDEILI